MSDSKTETPAGPLTETRDPVRVPVLWDFAQFALKAGAMLVAVLASAFAILMFIPDVMDYPQVTVKKHHRLAQVDTRKIVLVGGSNLAFGIDSLLIQQATGCPVVNMGKNGFLGVRYMLEEVRARLKPTDVVVLSFEWDSFYKSVDGSAYDLLAIVKANPAAFDYLTPEQKLNAIRHIPHVVQEKPLRLISEMLLSIKNSVTGSTEQLDTKENRFFWQVILNPAGTNLQGDVVSHLGLAWPLPLLDGVVPQGAVVDSQMISLVRDFTAEMTDRGVTVLVSYTPVESKFYDRHQKELSDAHNLISATKPLIAPSPPSDFAYPERYFFDTVYHMNAEGRSVRTQKLIDDIKSQLREATYCSLTVAGATAVN